MKPTNISIIVLAASLTLEGWAQADPTPSTGPAAQLSASDGAAEDSFGFALSLSGSTGLIGAHLDDSGAGSDQGSGYLFHSLDTASGPITQNGKLSASDGAAGDYFGIALSLSGSNALVGASADTYGAGSVQGSVYVFHGLDTASGSISQSAKLTASDGSTNDYFGYKVSLSGGIGLIGASGDDVGATVDQGSAYVFRGLDTVSGLATQNVKLTASDGAAGDSLGNAVSLSGSTGLVGAPRDTMGSSSEQGSAYVYRGLDTASGTMTQNVKLTASDGSAGDYFGDAVSISGSTGLVGAKFDDIGADSDRGSAYVYRGLDTANGTITQNVKLTASEGSAGDYFGTAVSLSGGSALVGASADTIGTNYAQGSAYLYRGLDTASGTMTQNVKLIASDGAAGNGFGIAVSLEGDNFLIGASGANGGRGKVYAGSVSSVTTLDADNAIRNIDGISFVSEDDWIIGQSTDSNSVTLTAGDSATVTGSGKKVYIGKNAGSDHNALTIAGTLTANDVAVGATGNTGNSLTLAGVADAVTVMVASGSSVGGTGTLNGNLTLQSGAFLSSTPPRL